MKHSILNQLAFCTALLFPVGANAVTIDIGPAGQRVEPGGFDIPGAPGSGTNGTNIGPVSIGGGISASIDNIDITGAAVGNIDWRDRGDNAVIPGDPLIAMGEDFVKNNAGIVRLTMLGIPAGTYAATTYHLDPGFTQSQNIQVFLDTGGGFANTGAVGNSFFAAGGVDGITTSLMQGSAANFNFTSNGVDPVILVFDGRTNPGAGENGESPLNGITFNLIPEPSATMLALLGAVALVFRRRR